jgi:hypothetical protein
MVSTNNMVLQLKEMVKPRKGLGVNYYKYMELVYWSRNKFNTNQKDHFKLLKESNIWKKLILYAAQLKGYY